LAVSHWTQAVVFQFVVRRLCDSGRPSKSVAGDMLPTQIQKKTNTSERVSHPFANLSK
jgi:hypothetical protein